MKKIFSSLLSLTMLFSLTTNSFVLAEEEPTQTEGTSENGGVIEPTLQERIDALPTVDEFKTKEESEQSEIYDEAEAISDSFNLLTEEEQAEIDTTKLEDLITYFNSLVEIEASNEDDDSSVGSDGDNEEKQSASVTLSLSDGAIDISPTGYTQSGTTYEFTGTYTITGSFTGDTGLDFSNNTESPVTYNIIFDNVSITSSTYCTAIRIQDSAITSKITLNITNKGTSKIYSHNHPVFSNQSTNNKELEVNITETEGSSLELKRTDSNSEMIYSGNSSVKINGTAISNTEAYSTEDWIINPSSSCKEINKGGTYYVKGGDYTSFSAISIETSEKVTFVIEGDITCNGIFLNIQSSGEVVVENEENHKINCSYFIDDESLYNAKITVNGGEYIGNDNALATIYAPHNTSEFTLDNCTFKRNNTSYKSGIYARNIKATNCTFETCGDAIVAFQNITLDGTNTFTNNASSDIKLNSTDGRLNFGDTFESNGQIIKVSLASSLSEGEKRRITENNIDAKYLNTLVAANTSYAINYDSTDKYYYVWEHTHTWTYNSNKDKNTIEAHCSSEDCIYHDNPLTAKISSPSDVYNGKQYSKTKVENNISSITGAQPYSITYEGLDGTDYAARPQAPTNAGLYRASFRLENTDPIIYANFSIAKAPQVNPSGLLLRDETIKGKHDGSIENLSTSMEYRKEGETTYTAITSTTLTGLASGKYYVRYKELENYEASKDTECIIDAKIAGLNVTVPSEQLGYTLTVDKSLVEYNESSKITFALNAGYSKTEDFKVKVNGVEITLDSNNEYTITNIQENQTITVEGVDDITAPTINGLENGKTYTKTQTFTVTEPNLKEVTVDGVAVEAKEGKYTLVPKNGTYTIIAKDLALNEMQITVTVNFEEVEQPTITSKTYTGKLMTADVKDTDNYEVTKNDGGTDVGKYDVKLTLKDAVNYKWKDSTETTITIPFEITKAKPTVEVKANSLTANGQKQELVTGKTSGGTLKYYVDGEWTTTVPKAKDAGTYTVKYRVDGDKNYEDVKESSITVKIKSKYIPSTNNSTQTSTTYTLVPTDTKLVVDNKK